MSRPVNAVLLSLLVLPGAGHFYLKRRARALLFIVPALASAMYFLDDLTTRSSAIVDQIMSGQMGTDLAAMTAQVERASVTPPAVNFAIYVMLACWIGSAIDAWLIARAQAPKA